MNFKHFACLVVWSIGSIWSGEEREMQEIQNFIIEFRGFGVVGIQLDGQEVS